MTKIYEEDFYKFKDVDMCGFREADKRCRHQTMVGIDKYRCGRVDHIFNEQVEILKDMHSLPMMGENGFVQREPFVAPKKVENNCRYAIVNGKPNSTQM